MPKTENLRVKGAKRLNPPCFYKSVLQSNATVATTVIKGRQAIADILSGKDKRFLVVVGPCSIHDPFVAEEYARRLAVLAREFSDRLLVVMRVYFEKPRTTVGWKGLINDPHVDGSCDIEEGLKRARKLLLAINELSLPAATEFLDPIVPQYIDDLIAWAAIGARTTESQTHRGMASGLSMPVGFKNGTDGGLQIAIDGMISARTSHSFIGIDQEGYTCIIDTDGNSHGHLVLRGGRGGLTNYDPVSLDQAAKQLIGHGLPPVLMVDCSHANSLKNYKKQEAVWKSVIEQRVAGNLNLIGAMIESNLNEGNQSEKNKPFDYGVSITDACVGWDTTKRMLREAHAALKA